MNFLGDSKMFSAKPLALILGITSVIAQVVLMRELVTVFYGNEIVYAVILASWLFWVALGSYVFSRVPRKFVHSLKSIYFIHFSLLIILPASIFFSRIVHLILGVPIGEMIGLIPMIICSFILLAPLSFVMGANYALICRYSDISGENVTVTEGIGTVYLWESLGSAVGGIVFSFILIHFFNGLELSFLVPIFNLCFLFAWGGKKKAFTILKVILFLLVVILALTNAMKNFDRFSRRLQWKGFHLVAVADSIYGNIAIVKKDQEYTLYENGLFSFSTKDTLDSENSVHFALLEHPDPRSVLLIGNGIGGALDEILKYPQTKVDYVELDATVISLSEAVLPQEDVAVLKTSKRVEVHNMDARLFIKSAAKTFDVIIVNLSDPYNALLNRYYTREFFKEASRRLNPQGLIALSVSSSENYINDETSSFLQSINSTLKSVFPSVISIPGDNNIFIAGKAPDSLTTDPVKLVDKLKEYQISTQYVSAYYIPFRMSPDRMAYIRDILKARGQINTDMKPVAYFYDIVAWSGHFNGYFKRFIEHIRGLNVWYLSLIPVFLFIIGIFLKKKDPLFPVNLSIITTGFSEIIFQIIVIIAFQSLYGYAYYRIGLIVGSFMVGLVLGSFWARGMIRAQSQKIWQVYTKIQLSIAAYPLLLPLLFVVFRNISISGYFVHLYAFVFALLPVVAGFMGGVQYPLAVELNYQHKKNKSGEGGASAGLAGRLYALDVFGATIGALLTAAILIPLIGIKNISVFCAILNGTIWILLRRQK